LKDAAKGAASPSPVVGQKSFAPAARRDAPKHRDALLEKSASISVGYDTMSERLFIAVAQTWGMRRNAGWLAC
jgi:hypothetical protein